MRRPDIAWKPISWPVFIAWVCSYGLLLLYLVFHFSEPTLLDNLHLVVHEGGHLLFSWFGERPELWGGTILQLLVPALLAVTFAIRADLPGTAFCAFGFFHSLTGVATYMIDALLLQLPLVTVGTDEAQHDWVRIFSDLGLLSHAIQIGSTVRIIAWCGMVGTVAWFSWRFWHRDPP
jgi:hypothetical protein